MSDHGDAPVGEVWCEAREGVGHVRLNRPEAINALTLAMIDRMHEQLTAWADDGSVERVELSGEGQRGFCAGADVRRLRRSVVDGDLAMAERFLRAEYALDGLIATYPKPMTSYLRGISMGGGLGIGLHCPTRVAASDLKLAMPEVGIGIWPDVGVAFELTRMPHRTGWLLALTGDPIDAASAQWAGLVDLVEFETQPDESQLAADACWIEECFGADSLADAVAALENHASERARQAAARIRTRSPLSVAVTWEHLRRAEKLETVGEVLAQDLALARAFFPDSEFVEGVRAQLVDKDRAPQWRLARLEDVDPAQVRVAFGQGN